MNRNASNPLDPTNEPSGERSRPLDFIRSIVTEDNRTGKWGGRVQTRFPPEPNGYLHIGHAKSICLNFGIAREFGGKCNLRFDDTNPTAEEQEYVDSIERDVQWLGWKWDKLLFASDYFQQMYDWAVELIKKGKAYVCDLPAEEISRYRGTLTAPGRESPWRNRTADESLDFFDRMRRGEFPDGSKTLRAKIDMTHANMNMRDPVMYRILHATHHNTKDEWCIYPMYDWAHGLEDSIEGVTHSICTLEFEDHHPLYDWYIDAINEGRGPGSKWGQSVHHPQQIEFARLELTDTLMSKRKLLELVRNKDVSGWNDPRMPTLSGMRRRGYTPQAIRNFCDMIGVAKFNSTVDLAKLEFCVRDDLNRVAPRVMAVLNPLKIVIDNYPAGQVEDLDAVNNPEDPNTDTRKVPFSREIYIEHDDFRETPPPKFFRLSPGKEVRLRYAYFITCNSVVKNPKTGEITELHCTYDPATRGGDAPDGRKVKATLHWVSAERALPCEVRLYEPLLLTSSQGEAQTDAARQQAAGNRQQVSIDNRQSTIGNPPSIANPADWRSNLNPRSIEIINRAWVEPSVRNSPPGRTFQFERLGYFCVDPDSEDGRPVFNRTVTLKDTWAKIEQKK